MQIMINIPDNIPRNELKFRIKEFEESLVNELKEDEEEGVLKEILNKLRSKKTFKGIKDPAAWQREIRRDRILPYR